MDASTADMPLKPRTYNGDIVALTASLTPLCAMSNWVVFRWAKNGSDKWTKPPFQSHFPSRTARNNDPDTWSPHAAAASAVNAGEADGIGFALTGTDIAAVDLDHCRDPSTGEIDAWAKAIVDRAAGAYCEITVSGTGLRLIGRGTGEKTHTNYRIEEGRQAAKLEIYRRAVRYITVSGLQIGACAELPNIDTLIDSLIEQYGDPKPSAQGHFDLGKRGINDLIKNGVPERQRSEAFQSVIFRLANAGLSIDEIERLLAKHQNGIAQKYSNRLRAEIERSYHKWKALVPADADDPNVAGEDSRVVLPGHPHDWHDPDFSLLDDRRGDLPEFPLDVLPDKWRAWVELAAHGAGVTPAHVAVPLIAIASSQIGTARRVQASRSWSESMTIWAAVVGASGTGKTPGIDATKRALSFIDRTRKAEIAKLALEHQTRAEAASAERKLWKKTVEEAAAENKPAPPMPASAADPGEFVAPKLYVSDATIERMAVLLQANPRGILRLSDELSSLFLI
jgi:hypothetical protein